MANSAFSDATHAANRHSDIAITSVASNDILKFDGTNWVNSNVIAGITSLTVDNLNLNGNTISSTAGTDLLITPLGGQQIVLDGTIIIDAGVVTGATSITSTEFVGGGVGLTALSAANITASGTLPVLNGSALTNLDADDLATGTVPVARLGDGNESNSTFLRGDNTWVAVTGTTINTNADNRVITGSGTANTLNGEAGLTYDGTVLLNTGNGAREIRNHLTLTSTADSRMLVSIPASASNVAYIGFHEGAGDGTSNNMGYRMGYDASANYFRIQSRDFNGSGGAGNVLEIKDGTGAMTLPKQPGVLAYNSASDDNITGDGSTTVTIDFDTEIYDQGGDFLNDTFTAPVTGRYFITATVRLEGLSQAVLQLPLIIQASNNDYNFIFNQRWTVAGVTNQGLTVTNIIDMDANDTVFIELNVQGVGSNTVDVFGQGASSMHTCWVSIMMVA